MLSSSSVCPSVYYTPPYCAKTVMHRPTVSILLNKVIYFTVEFKCIRNDKELGLRVFSVFASRID